MVVVAEDAKVSLQPLARRPSSWALGELLQYREPLPGRRSRSRSSRPARRQASGDAPSTDVDALSPADAAGAAILRGGAKAAQVLCGAHFRYHVTKRLHREASRPQCDEGGGRQPNGSSAADGIQLVARALFSRARLSDVARV